MENRGNSSLIYDILVASYLILMVLYERCSNMAELRNPLEARWNSPFDHSIAFRVFNQHFTELNRMYWAYAPAVTKTEKEVKKLMKEDPSKKPIDYLVVHDEDDRRLENDFIEWKEWYRKFQNYNRLNMLVSLSSCLEVYMRTIVSCAIESKPGALIGVCSAVDGVSLLKADSSKYKVGTWKYPYSRQVNMICQGTWADRIRNYRILFGRVPKYIEDKQSELDRLRNLRNNIAHNYGRRRPHEDSSVPTFDAMPSESISHEKLIKYMQLVYDTVQAIEEHLYKEYIGSYEIIKHYIMFCPSRIKRDVKAERVRWLSWAIGSNGLKNVGKRYYTDLIEYIERV